MPPHIQFSAANGASPALIVRDVPCSSGNLCCPKCIGLLDVSQPDAEDPDRIIGMCTVETCTEWYLIVRVIAVEAGWISVSLPSPTAMGASHMTQRAAERMRVSAHG